MWFLQGLSGNTSMRFVSYKMSLWLHCSIDESQMDLWLWLQCRPTFAIACWTSSTRHLKLKTAINKLIIFFSKRCLLSLTHLRESQYSQAITQASCVVVTILLSLSFQPSAHKLIVCFQKSLLVSKRFPWFFTPTSAPSYSVKSSCVQALKHNKASIHPTIVHLQNPQMVPFGVLSLFFVCLFCLALFWILFFLLAAL